MEGSGGENWERRGRLYERLLDLGSAGDAHACLGDALDLVIEETGARQGFLGLYAPGDPADHPRWSVSRGLEPPEVEAVQARVSRGIVAEALCGGRPVLTASAVDDPRFRELPSVAAQRVRSVVCVPVGASPPRGVLYLQDRRRPGPFTRSDLDGTAAFARRLGPVVERLIEHRDPAASGSIRSLKPRSGLDLRDVIGSGPALARVLESVELACRFDFTVLVTGPPGSGKTLLARAIHRNSRRSGGPFVEVNCANLGESLADSLLFGHEKGAFTGATEARDGKVRAADGGTLFLDEVGELPPAVQAKLLAFLQDGTVCRVGGTRNVTGDARVIAATNRDIEAAVAGGAVRKDFFDRLDLLRIRVPPLSERAEDVPALLEFHAARAARKLGIPAVPLSPAAVSEASRRPWSGNVRELSNRVELGLARAFLEGSPAVEPRHLFQDEAPAGAPGQDAGPAGGGLLDAMHRHEGKLVAAALRAAGGNVARAAEGLGIARSYCYTLIGRHGLQDQVSGKKRGDGGPDGGGEGP